LAARLCAGCPVRRECLEFELRTAGADTVGVWGGLSEDDREAIYAQERRKRLRAVG
jgi:WhiB family redox-sensing transcriptional regulator